MAFDIHGVTYIPNALIDDTSLCAEEKLVMMILISYYDPDVKSSVPSSYEISEGVGLSETMTDVVLSRLQNQGHIKINRSAGHPATYKILNPKFQPREV